MPLNGSTPKIFNARPGPARHRAEYWQLLAEHRAHVVEILVIIDIWINSDPKP